MRQLLLVDDLPLFLSKAVPSSSRAAQSGAIVETLRRVAPEARLLPFDLVRRWWSQVTASAAAVYVLVGTRPQLLHAFAARLPPHAAIVPVNARRHFDTAGLTVGAEVIGAPQPISFAKNVRIEVVDDVLMTGATAGAVLRTLRGWNASQIDVSLLVANARSRQQLHREFPEVVFNVGLHVDYEPIAEGTVMFVWDLLFGGIGGRTFLEQPGLLAPFLGAHLEPLHDLRRSIQPMLNEHVEGRGGER